MPEFTHDWFSPNIPTLTTHLNRFVGKPTAMLEIGCFEGRSTCWFLDNILTHPLSDITCIDTFEGSAEHKELGVDFSDTYRRFIANVGGRARVRRGESWDVLRSLSANHHHYQLVYVDGSHEARDVLTDMVLAWGMLERGGVMVCDDYGWDRYPEPHRNPRLAIDSFLACFTGQYKLLHCGYQVILERI